MAALFLAELVQLVELLLDLLLELVEARVDVRLGGGLLPLALLGLLGFLLLGALLADPPPGDQLTRPG
jgi:hypothetical protein